MKNNWTILLFLFGSLFFIASCTEEDPCIDKQCVENYVLDATTCVCVNLDPCASVTCAADEIKTSDCLCITLDPCAGVICGVDEICDSGNCIPISSGQTEIKVAGFVGKNDIWTSDKTYIMTGKVVVGEGAILTIEAGTIIKGGAGQGTLASALVVARGGKLIAQGTPVKPIIFTSIQDNIQPGQIVGSNLNETHTGLWGGLIILGKAPISVETGITAQIEGIPADDSFGTYGGTDPNDDSGVISYVSVRHGGVTIGEGNEINGITFGGVGAGTTVNNIEVVGNQDDGLEWFGGTVNVTNALVWAQGDDAFDIDQGYSGTLNNYVYIAGPDSDHGMEVDGPEGARNAEGNFTVTNGWLKGLTSEYADFRDGAKGKIENSYFFNFPASADLELDDDATSANYFAGTLIITGNQFNTTHLEEGNRTVETICLDKAPNGNSESFDMQMALDNAIVSTPSIGADVTVFDWTFASLKGAISN